MRLLFWRKQRRAVTEPILDGVKTVQLYVCPNCGHRVEKVAKCNLCGKYICSACGVLFHFSWWTTPDQEPFSFSSISRDLTTCKDCYVSSVKPTRRAFLTAFEYLPRASQTKKPEEEAAKMT